MSLERFIGIFSNADDMLREDLARLMEYLTDEWAKKDQ